MNNAKIMAESNSIPSIVEAGKTYQVKVCFINNGDTEWTEANQYRLGAQNPQDNTIWIKDRIKLEKDEAIAPGEEKVFEFEIVTPKETGAQTIAFQMLREFYEWFGEKLEWPIIVMDASESEYSKPHASSEASILSDASESNQEDNDDGLQSNRDTASE